MALVRCVPMLLAIILAAAPPKLPDGCVLEVQATGVVATCGKTAMASANLLPGRVAPADYVTVAFAKINGNPTSSKVKIRVASIEVDALQYSVAGTSGWIAALPEGGRVRVLGCVARGKVEAALPVCQPLLDAFGVIDVKPFAMGARGPLPEIGGKPLEVPPGCSAEKANQIFCGESAIFWVAADTAQRPLNGEINTLARGLPRLLGTDEHVSREDLRCTVGGQPGQCYRLKKTAAPGDITTWFLAGERGAGATLTWFVCVAAVDPVVAMPAVCRQMFELVPK